MEILLALGAGVLTLLYAAFIAWRVSSAPAGTEKMQDISAAIQEGANAFLTRQYKTLAPIVFVLLVLINYGVNFETALAFFGGVLSSALAGYVGMQVSVRANVRVAEAAKTGLKPAFGLSFNGGAVTGMALAGLGLIGVSGLYLAFGSLAPLIGYGFGASLMSLFARVGGGIYTKAADVGADLVGKVEKGIPEDDPRNPAVIADNVGDNVGDCAGMAADVFESFVVTVIAAMLIGLTFTVDSPLVGMEIKDAEQMTGAPLMLAIRNTEEPRLAPPADEMIWVGTILGVMGTRDQVGRFALQNQCRVQPRLRTFGPLFNASRAGISEVVIPPGSRLVGQTVGSARLRTRYGISVLAINRRGEILTEGVRDIELETGDCLVSHSTWRDLSAVARERDFIVATDIPKEEQRPQKVAHALVFFAISIGMIVFTEYRLSIALLVGAMGMILTGVLSIDEAYNSVSWKTVFLLASLIPLGQAMERTGTAAWIAQEIMLILGDVPELAIEAALAVLATVFTLVMSNVGATTILVPIAVSIALATGADPTMYALIIALSTSNAFILPTHQVNALIMGPGGYRVADFIRAGGLMSVIFIVVMLTMVNVIFRA